jgi:hypothetical protein
MIKPSAISFQRSVRFKSSSVLDAYGIHTIPWIMQRRLLAATPLTPALSPRTRVERELSRFLGTSVSLSPWHKGERVG